MPVDPPYDEFTGYHRAKKHGVRAEHSYIATSMATSASLSTSAQSLSHHRQVQVRPPRSAYRQPGWASGEDCHMSALASIYWLCRARIACDRSIRNSVNGMSAAMKVKAI